MKYRYVAVWMIQLMCSLLLFVPGAYAAVDDDNDGVRNIDDFCGGTSKDGLVDIFGCSCTQKMACDNPVYCCVSDDNNETFDCSDSSGYPVCNQVTETGDIINDTNEEYAEIPDGDVDGVEDNQDLCYNSSSILVDPFGCTCTQKTTDCSGGYCCGDDGDDCTATCGVVGGIPTCNVRATNCNENTCPDDTRTCDDGTVLTRDPLLSCSFPSCAVENTTCSTQALECSNGTFVEPDPNNNCEITCPEYYAPEEHNASSEFDEDGDGVDDAVEDCQAQEEESGGNNILMGALIGAALLILVVLTGGLGIAFLANMSWWVGGLLGAGLGAGIGALFGSGDEDSNACPESASGSA